MVRDVPVADHFGFVDLTLEVCSERKEAAQERRASRKAFHADFQRRVRSPSTAVSQGNDRTHETCKKTNTPKGQD